MTDFVSRGSARQKETLADEVKEIEDTEADAELGIWINRGIRTATTFIYLSQTSGAKKKF